MLHPRAILEATILGRLTRPAVDSLVAHHWARGDFVRRLPADIVPPVGVPRRRAKRYGLADQIVTDVLYGEEGGPGCLLVTTPCLGPYDRTFRRLVVAPHVHDSAHIAVVTRGRALFLVARHEERRVVLVTAELSRGSLVFYPAGAPHTFAGDEEFQVASLQATHKEPEREDFAQPSPMRFETLARVTYEEYRGRASCARASTVGDLA
jgi:AraC-like ligand binding domain